jgi:GAF domain-containing protein
MRDTPHVRIRTYPGGGGQEWAVASVTPIGRTPPPAEPFTDTELRLLAAVAGELWAAIQAGQPRDEKLARFQNELLNRAATLHRQQAAENQETGL